MVSEFQVEKPIIFLREDSSGQWNITGWVSPPDPEITPIRTRLQSGRRCETGCSMRARWLWSAADTSRFAWKASTSLFPTSAPSSASLPDRASFQGDTRLAAEGLIGPLNLDSFAETPFSAEGQLEANLKSLRATLQDWVPQITP